MPHELRGIERMPHEYFSEVLILAGAFIVAVVAFVLYLKWKHRKTLTERHPAPPAARRRVRKRKRPS